MDKPLAKRWNNLVTFSAGLLCLILVTSPLLTTWQTYGFKGLMPFVNAQPDPFEQRAHMVHVIDYGLEFLGIAALVGLLVGLAGLLYDYRVQQKYKRNLRDEN